MSTSYPTVVDLTARHEWVDIATVNANLASKDLTLQNVGEESVRVFAGGASAPAANTDGLLVEPGVAVDVNAANIWVFAYKGYAIAAMDNA